MYSKVILMAMCVYIYIYVYLLLLLFISVYSVYTMIQPYESHHRFATPVQPAVSAAGPDKLKVAMMQLSLNRKVVGHLSWLAGRLKCVWNMTFCGLSKGTLNVLKILKIGYIGL